MTRKTSVCIGVILAALVILGLAGRSKMLTMRARFESRRPDLDVMRQLPSDLGLAYEPFDGTNPEGTRIAGWWLPAHAPVGGVVMVHGFGQNKSSMLGRAAVFIEASFNVALIDLRARGESGGDRADMGPNAALDVLAAVDALVSSGRQTSLPLFAYGFSHGARTVVLAAARASPTVFSAIMAEAPPYSLREGLKRQTGLPWVPPLPEGDLPGAFAMLRNRPILMLLGDTDPEISEAQATSLLSSNAHPATGIVTFAKTGHGVLSESNLDRYRRSVVTFLQAAMKP
jgi:alpha-beta hydrolase superfamily lysophospholipase